MARRIDHIDHLGLRSAMADRLLPTLVGAVSFLAVLAIAGTLAASALSMEWQGNSASALTVQVPDPASPADAGKTSRLQAVLAILQSTQGVFAARILGPDEVNTLLKPWFGEDVAQLSLPVPAVIAANWDNPGPPDALRASLTAAAPGTLVETGTRWAERVAALTASLQACAAAILLIVVLVAACVISAATRAGLAQRRETIEIIHGLGALDSDIADRFAFHATILAVAGALAGTIAALPVLFWLASLVAPFEGLAPHSTIPAILWLELPSVPLAAAIIGWLTTQFTVRGWLRRLS